MSNLLVIYQEYALDMLYRPQTNSDVKLQAATYLDTRVLSQEHPAFPLYLLMSAPSFSSSISANPRAEANRTKRTKKYHLLMRCRMFRGSG